MAQPTGPGTLQPGRISPRRAVPDTIARPEYVGKSAPKPYRGPEVKDAETVERMRIAGRIAADALQTVGAAVRPGITTDELDRIGHEYLLDHNAYPSTLGYRGFPKSLCTSLNEVICHGIPDSTVIQDGDICNIDITAFIGGVHGDTNATFLAGDVDEESRLLVERTHEATMRAIKVVAPGRPLTVIGRVIERYAKRFNYGVVRDFTGHGIGTLVLGCLWAYGVLLGSAVFWEWTPVRQAWVSGWIGVGAVIVGAVGAIPVFLLAKHLRAGWQCIPLGVLTPIPLVGFFTLLSASTLAIRKLRACGVKVGFFGTDVSTLKTDR